MLQKLFLIYLQNDKNANIRWKVSRESSQIMQFYDPISLLFDSANMALTTVQKILLLHHLFSLCVYCLYLYAHIIWQFLSLLSTSHHTNQSEHKSFYPFVISTQLLNVKTNFTQKYPFFTFIFFGSLGGVFLIHLC